MRGTLFQSLLPRIPCLSFAKDLVLAVRACVLEKCFGTMEFFDFLHRDCIMLLVGQNIAKPRSPAH